MREAVAELTQWRRQCEGGGRDDRAAAVRGLEWFPQRKHRVT